MVVKYGIEEILKPTVEAIKKLEWVIVPIKVTLTVMCVSTFLDRKKE